MAIALGFRPRADVKTLGESCKRAIASRPASYGYNYVILTNLKIIWLQVKATPTSLLKII